MSEYEFSFKRTPTDIATSFDESTKILTIPMVTDATKVKDYSCTVYAKIKTRIKSQVDFTLTVTDVILTIDENLIFDGAIVPYNIGSGEM